MASENTCILVTGANTGLGYGICCRLIDEFLDQRREIEGLTLIFTTRSAKKGSDTLAALQARLAKNGKHSKSNARIHFQTEILELTNLLSIRALTRQLVFSKKISKLDAIILNAGIAGVSGIDWLLAVRQIMAENAAGVTWPRFKLSPVGALTARQLSPSKDEPPLGEIFCANVFGHYMLAHWLMPLLRACPESKPGRVIWVSSIEVKAHHFDPADLQGLRSRNAYEHSKRLTDLLALTAADQPATRASVAAFTSVPEEQAVRVKSQPVQYDSHPGVLQTAIVPQPWLLMQAWIFTAYLARWLGSPWHTNTAWNGAVSATWLALAEAAEIEGHLAKGKGVVKWGSAVDRRGTAKIEKTDVAGWGLDGSGRGFEHEWWAKGWLGPWGRVAGATDATAEDVERFVEDGARVWREMEQLRVEWEGRIEAFEKDSQP